MEDGHDLKAIEEINLIRFHKPLCLSQDNRLEYRHFIYPQLPADTNAHEILDILNVFTLIDSSRRYFPLNADNASVTAVPFIHFVE